MDANRSSMNRPFVIMRKTKIPSGYNISAKNDSQEQSEQLLKDKNCTVVHRRRQDVGTWGTFPPRNWKNVWEI